VAPFPSTSVQAPITMKTDSTNTPSISISAWVNVAQNILLTPASIVLQQGPLAANVPQTVSIRSTSSNLVEISNPECSLPGVQLSLTNIQPGRYYVLNATFPAGLNLGPSEKPVITLKTSHPNYPELKITVSQSAPAPVQAKPAAAGPITLSPQYAILNLSPETPSNAVTLRITNSSEQAISISEAQSRSPLFGTELKTLVEGREFELMVKSMPPFPTNSQPTQITLHTTSPTSPTLNVTAFASYQQTVMARPSQVSVPAGKLTNDVRSNVVIQNVGTNAFNLSDVSVNLAGVTVKVVTNVLNKQFLLTLNFPAGVEINPEDKVALTVKTSHPNYPEIRVPVVPPVNRPAPPAPPNVPGAIARPLSQ
jgi:hypothetical protein